VLSPADHGWWVVGNARGDALYTDPASVDSTVYDRRTNPGARSWFKDTAHELLSMTSDYLRLLDRYGVPWVELRTASPGRRVYEDEVQVVAVPYTYAEDWPLAGARPTGGAEE
jgi:hypothetical protein